MTEAESLYHPWTKLTIPIVSVSGGKDSTALYVWAIEKFGKDGFKAVFADTGHEHPVTYNYVRNLHQLAGGPEVHWVQANFSERLKKKEKVPTGNPFLDLWVWKGRAPSAKAQFCTEFLKLEPIRNWIEEIRGDMEVLILVGVRAGESARRAKLPVGEFSEYYDGIVWRPLLHWTEEQVFDFLKSKGIEPNPLYGAGYTRVGCYPCIHARKSELARLPEWAWDKLLSWERATGRTFFSPLKPGEITNAQTMREWAQTTRGGVQFDMFPPDETDVPSCMATWGACE